MFFGKPFLIVILFVVCSVDVSGQQTIFTVSGEISFPGTGDLYVQLITKEEFDSDRNAGFGIIIVVGPENVKKGRTPFAFTGVPGGRYGIRCFQDVSGTGKMEKGMFGPKEPWGTYRPARPAFRAPRFDEISFEVNKDIGEIKIELK